MKSLTFLLCLASLLSAAQNMCECTPNASVYASILQAEQGDEINTYTDASTLLDVLGAWGQWSANLYDINADGTVDTADLLLVLGGYGNESLTSICDFDITGTWSSAWQCDYPGTVICFLHISVTDETDLDWDACPLNTFWTERLVPQGILREYWKQ